MASAAIGASGGDKQQTTTSYVDYERMVREAEKAGFNPLTAIRNGGSAGFTSSTTTLPGLSGAEVVGQALGAGANFLANFDPMADQKRELEYQLVQAQIQNLQADTAARSRVSVGGVPAYSAGVMKRNPGAAALSAASVSGASQPAEVQIPGITNPLPPMTGWQVNPGLVDAQNWEDRYGEIAGGIFAGGINALGDMAHIHQQQQKNLPAGHPHKPGPSWRDITDWWNSDGAPVRVEAPRLGNYGKPYRGNSVFQ